MSVSFTVLKKLHFSSPGNSNLCKFFLENEKEKDKEKNQR